MEETRVSKRREGKSTNDVQFASTSTQDSTSMDPLFPEEIIVEILTKLPVKSLLQFRCVSKSWFALISSPEFVKLHLHSSANDKEYNHHRILLSSVPYLKDCSLRSLLYNPITEPSELDFPMRSLNVMSFIYANGLICLALSSKSRILEVRTFSRVCFCIGNPSIRKWKKLPEVQSRPIRSSSFSYGFGYDELRDDYKLVLIFTSSKPRTLAVTKVKIYSLKNDSWSTVRDYQGGPLIKCSAKFFKGKLYWYNAYKCNIISFDLADETWDKVEQPDYGEGKFDVMLGVLGSDLVVRCYYHTGRMDVWVMKDYGVKASWTKMFTIMCPEHPGSYYPASLSPLFIQSCNGEILLLCRSRFMIYNPMDDSIRYPEVTGDMHFEAETFVESLVNPLVADQGHEDREY